MVRYSETVDGVTANQLCGFFEGWQSPPDAQTHLRLLQSSDHVILSHDPTSGHVVGFITAVTDRVLSAYIPFLEVRRDYRHRGIGRELVGRMLKRLDDLYMVDLMCDPSLQPFYRSLGMIDGTGMMIRNYACQPGRAPAASDRNP